MNVEAASNDITEHPHDDNGRHTDKLYSCAYCDKCFNTYRSLSLHMNVHSSKYKCTECGKCFSTKRRNRLNVLFVVNNLHSQVNLFFTAEFTVERNLTNVSCVTRHLVSPQV